MSTAQDIENESPRPWTLNLPHDRREPARIEDRDGFKVVDVERADPIDLANARLIVDAVNAYVRPARLPHADAALPAMTVEPVEEERGCA